MDIVVAAVCSGIVGIIGGIGGAYVLIRKTNSELTMKEQEARAKILQEAEEAKVKRDREARGEEDRARKQERTEYKQLYLELKSEVALVRGQERDCQRRCRRLELAIVGAGISLPPLEDDNNGDGDVSPPNVQRPQGKTP